MNIAGNTILITGGGSGIGRGLAEAFHAAGNQVIIAGRRQQVLDETTKANPGMRSLTLNVEDAASITAFAAKVAQEFPALNVLVNNAGIMRTEDLTVEPFDLTTAEATITTNLLGPIRLTAALLPLLKKQKQAAVMNVTSGLAFMPLALTPTYSATKAAMHAYTQSLRYQLQSTAVEVLELIPPYVQTELMGEAQATDSRAMPLDKFIAESMAILKAGTANGEITVETVNPLRFAEKDGKFDAVFKMLNDGFAAGHH